MNHIPFTYDKESDQLCWRRYNDFIKQNGDVWGIKKEVKQIFELLDVNVVADVTEIVEKYDGVFKLPAIEINGFVVTTPFSMINDGGEFSEKGIVYYSFFTPNPSVVLAHEIFHIYFEKYTKRAIPNYEEAKEYFTVILNDLFGNEVSRGYPKHQETRKEIYDCWMRTKSIDECIKVVQ